MDKLDKYLMMFIIFLMIVSIVLQSITLYKASKKAERYTAFSLTNDLMPPPFVAPVNLG